MILVDIHEPQPILMGLGSLACRVALPTGDYSFYGEGAKKVIVERKTPADLLNAISTGRFQDQIVRTIMESDYALVLIEGAFSATKDGFIRYGGVTSSFPYTGVMDLLLTCQLSGAYLVTSSGQDNTVAVLKSLYHYFQKPEHVSLQRPKRFKLFPDDINTQREALMCAIPGIGPEMAKRLLAHFGAPINVFLADEGELMAVDGVGKAKVKTLVEILYPGPDEVNPATERAIERVEGSTEEG
jgi:DNA excision repair protein ERCC-4